MMNYGLSALLLLLLAWSQVKTGPVTTEQLFHGGSDSTVAVAIGAAEGTRAADGSKTEHWESHTDHGNGVTNQGTFSYQHGAATPEEADKRQLEKLDKFTGELQSKADTEGISLGALGLVAGLDLYTQSEAAAGDFVGHLKDCGDPESVEAIVCARTKSYYEGGVLNAPGLGNDPEIVETDQRRRVEALEEVIRLAD